MKVGSDDKGVVESLALLLFDGPVDGALRAVNPEIDSWAEPVVVIVALPKVRGIREDFFSNGAVTAMVANDRAETVSKTSASHLDK